MSSWSSTPAPWTAGPIEIKPVRGAATLGELRHRLRGLRFGSAQPDADARASRASAAAAPARHACWPRSRSPCGRGRRKPAAAAATCAASRADLRLRLLHLAGADLVLRRERQFLDPRHARRATGGRSGLRRDERLGRRRLRAGSARRLDEQRRLLRDRADGQFVSAGAATVQRQQPPQPVPRTRLRVARRALLRR